jgi:hypothetical protein
MERNWSRCVCRHAGRRRIRAILVPQWRGHPLAHRRHRVGGGGTRPRPWRPGCWDPFVPPPLSSTSSLLAPSSCTKGGARGTATVSSEGREKRRRGEEEQRGVAKRGLTTSPMGLHPGFFLSRAGPSGLCHSTLFSGGRRRASMVPV